MADAEVVLTPPEVFTVQDADGRTITLMQAPKPEGRVVTPLEIANDPGRGTKQANMFHSPKEKIVMYRGATPSLVPMAHFQSFLRRGFTPRPTADALPLKFECNVLREDGTRCPKKFTAEVNRLTHIKAYHGDVAPWVLSAMDQRKLRRDLGVTNDDVRNIDTFANVDLEQTVLTLVEKKLKEILGTEHAAAIMAEEVAPDVAPAVRDYARIQTEHAPHCTSKGRWRKYTSGCPRCDELRG